ncbi:response regulator transcription factor [Gordonia sp. HY285]|uniref:response regulator transcription factor n=1 Tax=Gordonia liuliyuniae TaxID=2911517 RepID=UPI001F32B740|nr:response regulator transcription factor [Gordonia liuliyuniae]MCF8611082.1 response regulator transcription factor [Gordonia liuliyuniae]
MTRLLLIEDDPQIVEALKMSLERLDYTVTSVASDPGDSLPTLLSSVDAVILDIGLPGSDGFSVCRAIRAISDVPVIMLTARSDDIDMVAGLEAGADDYVVKPVSPRVLDARVKANVRRVNAVEPGSPPRHDVITFGGLTVDRTAVQVSRDGEPIALSPTETRLVFAFADHPGQVLSRDQLLEMAWDQTYLGDSRLVDNAIQRLRAKIDPADVSLIETVRGFGYRFVP